MIYIFSVVLILIFINFLSFLDEKLGIIYFIRVIVVILSLILIIFIIKNFSIIWNSLMNIGLMLYLLFYDRINLKNKSRITEELIYWLYIPLSVFWIFWLGMLMDTISEEWIEIHIILSFVPIFIPLLISGYLLWKRYISARVTNIILSLTISIVMLYQSSTIDPHSPLEVRYTLYGISICTILLFFATFTSYFLKKKRLGLFDFPENRI